MRQEYADASASGEALDRFRREVKLARRVTHPNVARTFDLGTLSAEQGGVRFITMELIEGEPLSRRIGQGRRLALPEALRICAEVARGLAAAHAVGVVHRDLKPDNVMLEESGRVVITDFGIARLAEGAAAGNATRTVGSAIGTPAYMAPEQVEGRELDGRADIFALGIVLYEMLTGELPFQGDTVYALAAARLASVAPDPRAKVADIPEGVAQLCRKILARRREERPDAQEALRRLEELRGARVERAEPTARAPISIAGPTSVHTPAGPKTIAVVAQSGTISAGTNDLIDAIADALVPLRGLRVLPTATVRAATQETPTEASTLGKVLAVDFVLEASVRVASGRARARARLVQVSGGTQLWSERFEAAGNEPFALEDAVVAGVAEALRMRLSDEGGRRGPSDPDARDAYRRARVEYVKFGPGPVRTAIEILRGARASSPNDPWILSALGAALTRHWVLTGSSDAAVIQEAEEVSLRALAVDASIGETFDTIGILRLQQGETRAAVRAFQEAVARSPLLAEAHEYLGRLLCECGHPDEGLRRLDLAIRLDPNSVAGHWERARTYALLGDREKAEAGLARSLAVADSAVAQVLQRARLALWWKDRAMAQRLVQDLAHIDLPIASVRDNLVPLLERAAAGEPLGEGVTMFRVIADTSNSSLRQRAFFRQISVEFYCAATMWTEALEALETAADLPLVDVLWMDHCPLLAPLRDDAVFARCRAMIASRAAEAWS